ncbi:TPA: hypothetical protein ACH1TP_002032 [Enterobacter roggenkampii]
MNTYLWSSSKNAFIPAEMVEDYRKAGWDISELKPIEDSVFFEYSSPPPEGKERGSDDGGMPMWVDAPPIPNSTLRKDALAALSRVYQDDIEKLNRAWLAAAVNDGVNETAKKDIVLAQINARKEQYANDRAAIIAQYPD